MLGVTAIAYNIPDEIIKRFTKNISRFSPSDTKIHLVTKYDLCHYNGWFSRTIGGNAGIKALREEGCDVIACLDIDVLVPPKMLKQAHKEMQTNKNVWWCVLCRFINLEQFQTWSWEQILKVRPRNPAVGGCNIAHWKSWKACGGWNENIYGYGKDDTDLKRRAKRISKLKVCTRWPVVHINHPDRYREAQSWRSKENVKQAAEDLKKKKKWL